MISRLKVLLSVSLFVFAWTALSAQTETGDASHGSNGNKLKMVVVLSRHGVRPPTWTMAKLNSYASQPWPEWSVAPGLLTARGYDLLKLFGTYDRASLAKAGLIAAQGCAPVADIYIWADTDSRTLASGHAMADSLLPGCSAVVHSLAEGVNDPIFHPTAEGVDPADADRIFAEFSKRVAALPASEYSEQLTRMNRLVRGCKLDADCTPQRPPEINMMDEKTSVARGKGDRVVSLKGPLPIAGSFSEDLLLEYTEGMPMQSVGWGKVDEAEIVRLLKLHSIYFDLMHSTPSAAKAEGSNMLNHIVWTLQQGAEGKSVDGAIGEPGKKLVVIMGHDTNIATVATLLGMHWTLDGRSDDTPPGTELSFELWQTPANTYLVRVKIAMQTLRQMREVQPLTLANPPVKQTLDLPACGEGKRACTWDEFRTAAGVATAKK